MYFFVFTLIVSRDYLVGKILILNYFFIFLHIFKK